MTSIPRPGGLPGRPRETQNGPGQEKEAVFSLADERARREHYKAGLAELEFNRAVGNFVEKETMCYYFSFILRAFHDQMAAVKKVSPDLERLYRDGKRKEAEKRLVEALRVAFMSVMDALVRGIETEGSTGDAL